MRKYTINTLPKQWYILADTNAKDTILVDYYNTEYKQDLSRGRRWSGGWNFFSEKVHNANTSSDEYYLALHNSVPDGFQQISIEEFQKYVLNQDFESNTNEDHSSLIRLLKEI